jgi:hypothetical protein
MKTISIETERRPVAEWLPPEDSTELVCLTRQGEARFIVLPVDEGDLEAAAIRKNTKLMDYIAGCVDRACTEPTKTMAQIRLELGLGNPGPGDGSVPGPDR